MGGSPGDVSEEPETQEKRKKGWRMNCDVGEVIAHSPTLPSLYLRHSYFSNHSVASPTSHFILQPFFRFSYVTSSSLNSPGEPPIAPCESHYSITYKHSLHVTNNFIAVGLVGNLFCGRPSYK